MSVTEANSMPVSMKDVRAKSDEFFPVVRAVPAVTKPERHHYDKRALASEKAYVECKDVQEWADYKRAETGSKKRVSDLDFIRFRRGEPLIPRMMGTRTRFEPRGFEQTTASV